MMQPPLDQKPPDDVKDYGINWDLGLPSAVTISGSAWEITNNTVDEALSIDADDFADRATSVRLSGGEAGHNYTLVNTITTSTGEELEWAIEIRVRTAAVIAGIT